MIKKYGKVVHCKKSPYDIYIGRPSEWGNPFSHKEVSKALFKVKDREEAIQKFEEWILLQHDLMRKIHELKGKVLGCWCFPERCHGEVLLKLANEMYKIRKDKNISSITLRYD